MSRAASPARSSTVSNVKIIGYKNMPGRVANDASMLYAKNLFNFLSPLIDKESKSLKINFGDEIIVGTLAHARWRGRSQGDCPGEGLCHALTFSLLRFRFLMTVMPDFAFAAEAQARNRSGDVPAFDLRDRDFRRLLRRVERDAGAAHAADVGHQRDLFGDCCRRVAWP